MKITKIMISLLLCVFVQISYAQNVTIANKNYNVIFKDETLTSTLKKDIAEDLSRYFMYTKKIGDLFDLNDGENNQYKLEASNYEDINESLKEELYLLVNQGVTNIVVNKNLSDVYKNKFSQLASVSNAMARASALINSLNDGSLKKLPPNMIQKKVKLNPNKTPPIMTDSEVVSEIYTISDLMICSPICVIDFQKKDFWEDGNEYWCFEFRFRLKDASLYNPFMSMYLIYMDGDWAICGFEEMMDED